MHITVLCVGKLEKSAPEQTIIDRYLARTPWSISFVELDLKKNLPDTMRKEAEAELLLEALPKKGKIIALDERGKSPSTPQLAAVIQKWQEQGDSQLSFIIGGAFGLDPSILQKADYTLSFGALTWPHMLIRPMLAEQLYRLYTLLTNHPYHK